MALGCRQAVALFALSTTACYPSLAQEVTFPPSAVAQQRQIPDSILYGALFRQAAAFYQTAVALDQAGKDGSPYRRHLAHKFNLSSSEVLALEEAGLQYNLRVKPIDAAIASSAARWRTQLGVVPDGTFPPLPPEAAGLLAKRAAAIDSVRDSFHAAIGDVEFARIDSLLKKRVRRISQGTPHQGGTAQ